MAAKKTAIVIGLGDGRATQLLHSRGLGFDRFITVRLPGEQMVSVPGLIFDAGLFGPGDLVRDGWDNHQALIALNDAEFFDQHPITVSEDLRAEFALEFYRLLADKPLDFGDDILDGLQGAYHLAFNAKHILPAPLPREIAPGGRFSCPVIAVASGPSLSQHLPLIRALQRKAIIICADSALDGLINADIVPHFVTPVERIPEIARAFSSDTYPGITFAGKGVVHTDVTRRFAEFLFTPCTDILYKWAGAQQDDLLFYGQSTGVMAVTLGCQLTSGTVYLAGHDLAMAGDVSHWTGAKAVPVERKDTFPVPGYSGEVQTDWWWDNFRRQIGNQARIHGNVVNLNAVDGIGAIITHTLSGSLPQPADLPDLIFPERPEPNEHRIVAFRENLRRLPKDVAGILCRLSSRRLSVEDLAMERLCPSPNSQMFAYILRSVYAQFSYETYANKSTASVVFGLADALRNVFTQCRPMLEDMARAADA